jgi:16S rRNA (cytosine967-C5)-methyltransferase
MNQTPPVALRVALSRTTRDAVAARLAAERPDASIVASPLVDEGLLVRGAGAVDALTPFQEGLVTVQDVAAQLVGRLCGARPGERILDACAGVGGKSLHLADLAGGPVEIHAADLSRRKLDLAEDAARRLGIPLRTIEADLTRADAPLAAAYDRVLLDAPCSGLGVLRRHPESKWRRRAEEVGELAALQARLLDAVAARVRPGGALVYSVCTFTREEGAAQIARLLAARPDFSVEPTPLADADGFLRTWPHRHDADGFFAARLARRA